MAEKEWAEQIKTEGTFNEVVTVVARFDCRRNGRKYRVEITDSGNPDDISRYMITVINPNGTQNSKARGNGGKTIKEAIQVVHWSNLEQDENALVDD
jgi:hypothetical protein